MLHSRIFKMDFHYFNNRLPLCWQTDGPALTLFKLIVQILNRRSCTNRFLFVQSNKLDKPEKVEVSDNVKVVVRCRPLNEKEKMMGHKRSVTVDEIRGTISVSKLDMTSEPPKTFTFDTVFSPDSKQLDVYNLTARPIIDSVLEGYNGKSKTI